MLSESFFSFFHCLMTTYRLFGVTDLTWDIEKRRVILCEQKVNSAFTFSSSCIVVWLVLHLVQLVKFYFSNDYNKLNFLVAFTIALLLFGEGFVVQAFFAQDTAVVVNAFLIYLPRMNSKI